MKQLVGMYFSWGEVRAIYGEWEGVLLRLKFHWLRCKVLGIPHLHGEACRDVEPCNFPGYYVTSLR